jgi:acyl-coenzyme A synthetase/AMP-(fatty) acid ligase
MSPSSLLLSFFESLGEREALVMEGFTKTYRDLVRVMADSNPMADSIHDTVGVRPRGEANGTNEEPWTFIAALFRALSQHRAFDVGRRPQTLSGLWLQTTGTTGEPKSVHHAWDRWLAQYNLRDRGSSKILQVMALDHIGGLHSLFTALTRGMTVVIPATRDGFTVHKALQEHAIRILPTTPAHLALLLQSGCFDRLLPDLRLISYGAEAMSSHLKDAIAQRQPHIRWRETYGSTETGILPMSSGSLPGTWRPQFAYRIVEGELWVQGLSGTWMATGDTVEEVSEGLLRYKGRHSARVKVGGVMVSLAQIASWFRTQEHIWQAEVNPVPNPILGQVLEATIWPSPGTDQDQLEQTLRRSIPKDWPKEFAPLRYHFVETVQTNNRLKIQTAP